MDDARLGNRRNHFRDAQRQTRPREDNGGDAANLFGLHGSLWLRARMAGFHNLPFSSGHGGRRHVWGGHDAGGRKCAWTRPLIGTGFVAGIVRDRQYRRLADYSPNPTWRNKPVGPLLGMARAFLRFTLREPDAWKLAKAEAAAGRGRKTGSPIALFREKRWRKNALVGLFLGLAGMFGLWGIGFFSPELISTALAGAPQHRVDTVRGWGLTFQDGGSLVGMLVFTYAASRWSRRGAFLVSFILSLVVTAFVFHSLRSAAQAYWMLPLMGFAQLGVFAGYSIYFPELFPTRLRGTGVGFCYNTVRYLAAPAPWLMGKLSSVLKENAVAEPFRIAAVIMCSIFFVGMIALLWAPETKGKPLPED